MGYINFEERAAEAFKKLLDSEEFRNALDKLRDLAVILVEDVQAYIEEIKKKRHTYIRKMSVISKKALNMINSKVVRRKTNARAREIHSKVSEEVEEEE